MAKNLIPQIAKMLGVAIGEEFKIKDTNMGEFVSDKTYKFSENALVYFHQDDNIYRIVSRMTLLSLLNGNYEVVKIPWKPKMNERYWSFMVRRNYAAPDKIEWSPAISIWTEHPTDLALLDKGWVYRTCAEAEAALPAVAKELGVEYKL